MSVSVDLTDPLERTVQLTYSADGEPRSETIQILSRPMRFGGLRYYFRCPATARRCEKLYRSGGRFVSRQAGRLTYASQSEGPLDRMIRAKGKLEKRLWPEGKRATPRGRNRRALIDRWSDLEERVDRCLDSFLAGVAGRLLRMGGRSDGTF